jgi:hypothetical protein
MNTTLLFIFVLLTSCITIFLLVRSFRTKKEGFADVPEDNPLITVMGTIRRLSGKLMDISMWKERITMASMTPVELARYHIKSSATSEDA